METARHSTTLALGIRTLYRMQVNSSASEHIVSTRKQQLVMSQASSDIGKLGTHHEEL